MIRSRLLLSLATLALLAQPGGRLVAGDTQWLEMFRSRIDGSAGGSVRGALPESAGVRDEAERSAGSTNSKQDGYTHVRIPIPVGFVGGVALDVNNRGAVSGLFFEAGVGQASFLWQRGQEPQIIRFPGLPITSVGGISDSGVLFGNWGSETAMTAGFYLPRQGTWHPLPPYPGKTLNWGEKANNAGQGVGKSCNGTIFAPTDCVVWIWNGSGYEAPPALNAIPGAGLWGINEPGVIVGFHMAPPPNFVRALMYDGTTVTTLLPGQNAAAFDVNNRGEVLLDLEVEPWSFRTALLRRGEVTLLPRVPGALAQQAIGLNERGDFCGIALDPTFQMYPFVSFEK